MRTEKDYFGEKEIPEDALYGIHSLRARENFPMIGEFNRHWYAAMASVKRACYLTAGDFFEKAEEQFNLTQSGVRRIPAEVLDALIRSAVECEEGLHHDQFIVPAVSGGAGTSINMNMNEILANLALKHLGRKPGDYDTVDPTEHANIFQSTNDTVPTALKLAAMRLLAELEEKINQLRAGIEQKEKDFRHVLRIAYTQMQEAVPSTYGKLFSAYSDMLSRDWWRISKCTERIKVVNLGGSATGTSLTVPRFFVAAVVQNLNRLTGLPVTRGENLQDATQNLDALVEVHGILKAHAVNLEKLSADLRLAGSDLFAEKAVQLPGKQVGSSIMPAKVNPVIPEFIISCSHKIYANDQLIAGLAAQGCFDLNAYLPVIGDALLNSLELLIAGNVSLAENLIQGLTLDAKAAEEHMLRSPGIATALLPYIGYHRAAQLSDYMRKEKTDIYTANRKMSLIDEKQLRSILEPANLLKGGFSLNDLKNNENGKDQG